MSRYYVVAVSGYPTNGGGTNTKSYSVLDSAYAHREVFTRYSASGWGNDDRTRRAQCEQEAERLNLLDQAHMAEAA